MVKDESGLNVSYRTGVATTQVRIRKLYHGAGGRERRATTTWIKATSKHVVYNNRILTFIRV